MSEPILTKLVPNYVIPCVNCDQTPTVDYYTLEGKFVSHSELCGLCCFGEADCIDPENW